MNTYWYVRGNPLFYYDSKGLYEMTACSGDDCPNLDKLKRQIKARCRDIEKTIKDVGLASCIKKQCESGKITCRKTCPGRYRGYFHKQFPEAGANICIAPDSPFWEQPDPSVTVIHEWAHQCGWDHGMGGGVPNDPGTD